MKAQVVEALEGSIKKWEAIVAGTGKDYSCSNCPLCRHFDHGDCRGADGDQCPVAEATSALGCLESPYDEWQGHHHSYHPEEWNRGLYVMCAECQTLAERELEFLKSLLPKEV